MKLRHLFFVFAVMLVCVYAANAAEKTVAWDASPRDVQGYRISISADGGTENKVGVR